MMMVVGYQPKWQKWHFHPFIARQDQARLMRNLSLTFSQFVLLRLEGAIRVKDN
jgi:hypothetical protein